MTKKKKFVPVGGINAKINIIECGVPQVSVLGPLLYIIYTYDLSDTLNCVKSILFAHDITLYYSSSTVPHLYKTMIRDLNSLTDWFQANKFSQNVSKTNHMIFSSINSQHITMEIKLTNKIISKINCVIFLGVFIGEHLKEDEHI